MSDIFIEYQVPSGLSKKDISNCISIFMGRVSNCDNVELSWNFAHKKRRNQLKINEEDSKFLGELNCSGFVKIFESSLIDNTSHIKYLDNRTGDRNWLSLRNKEHKIICDFSIKNLDIFKIVGDKSFKNLDSFIISSTLELTNLVIIHKLWDLFGGELELNKSTIVDKKEYNYEIIERIRNSSSIELIESHDIFPIIDQSDIDRIQEKYSEYVFPDFVEDSEKIIKSQYYRHAQQLSNSMKDVNLKNKKIKF